MTAAAASRPAISSRPITSASSRVGHRHDRGDVRRLRLRPGVRMLAGEPVEVPVGDGERAFGAGGRGPLEAGGGDGRQPTSNATATREPTASRGQRWTGCGCGKRATGREPNVGSAYPAGHGNRYVFLHPEDGHRHSHHEPISEKHAAEPDAAPAPDTAVSPAAAPSLTLPQVERMALLLTALLLVGLHLGNLFKRRRVLARRGGRSRLREYADVGPYLVAAQI